MDNLTSKMLESAEADNANDVQRCYTSNQIHATKSTPSRLLKFLLPWETGRTAF